MFFIASSNGLYAQHTTVEKDMAMITRKDISFMVRKPDQVKNIANRFHISAKLLTKLNPHIHKRQIMYAGKQLLIPVWLKRKNTTQDATDFNLADYELNTDSLDVYIREDFICMADIEADTIRKISLDRQLKKIDGKIAAVNLVLDSIEEDGMRNLSKRDIRKMPMDRARRIGNFKIGAEIDSLKQQRQILAEERVKIDMRLADFDYLIENATYMANHTDTGNNKAINIKDWGDDTDKVIIKPGKNKKQIN
jgi:hypothetical protein